MNNDFKTEWKGVEIVLTEKEHIFAKRYVQNGFNSTEAMIYAGYSPKTAGAQGSKQLKKVNVNLYVKYLKENLHAQLDISAFDIANELKKIGFSDVRQLFDKNGDLHPIHKLDEIAAASISDIEVEENMLQQTTTKKIKRYNKIDALIKLARMCGLDGVEKSETTIKLGKDRADEDYV